MSSQQLLTPFGETDHVRGSVSVPIQIIEYGDFECSHCWQAEAVLTELLEKYAGQLNLVFRYMPLDKLYPIHPHATLAARAAEAAAKQGKFWEMHDALFAYQDSLKMNNIIHLATESGLNLEQFEKDLKDPVVIARVDNDFQSGLANEVNSTPILFINGERLTDSRDHDELRRRVAELAKK